MTFHERHAQRDLDALASRWLLRQVRERLVECHLLIERSTKGVTVEENGDLIVTGYASTGDVDRMDDIIEPSAFRKSLNHFLKTGTVLGHHNTNIPVGEPLDAWIDEKGVVLKTRIKAGFDPATPEGRVYTGVKLGLIRAYSVGFRILQSENVETADKGGMKITIERVKRLITDLDWYETSVVVIPANRSTMFSVRKAFEDGTDWPDEMYAEHRIRAALSQFRYDEEQEEDKGDARAVNMLRLRISAGNLAMATGAINLRGSVGE